MTNLTKKEAEEFAARTSKELNDIVFNRINRFLEKNPASREHLCPALPFPRELRLGLLDTCLVVEYVGPNDDSTDIFDTTLEDNDTKDLYDFLGIDLSHLSKIRRIPVQHEMSNVNFFIGDSIGRVYDYMYDLTQIPNDSVIGGLLDVSKTQEPLLLINCTYFWIDSFDNLKIRHVDLLEISPYQDDNVVYHDEDSFRRLSDYLIGFRWPTYKVELHRILNEFIHLISDNETSEPEITKYLQDNPEILQLSFGCDDLNSQTVLEWQYQTDKDNLKPDFLPMKMDGFCDILEFKLPILKTKPMVGKPNRRNPSHEIDKAIAQLDDYEDWVAQEVNRQWLKKKYGIDILQPTRILVIGHSEEFTAEDRRKLRDTRNSTIYTYDEFIELARSQIYRVRS